MIYITIAFMSEMSKVSLILCLYSNYLFVCLIWSPSKIFRSLLLTKKLPSYTEEFWIRHIWISKTQDNNGAGIS